MTKDIIRMAREAGIKNDCDGIWCNADQLRRFANLAVAHKTEVALAEAYRCGYKAGMEAAAVVCENLPMQQQIDVRDQCAIDIRAKQANTV